MMSQMHREHALWAQKKETDMAKLTTADLKHDFSTPEIMDRVWSRVSASIDADMQRQGFSLIDDDAMEMLSAAGEPSLGNIDPVSLAVKKHDIPRDGIR